ncbi:hypothetical protein HOD38_00730 [archaeon]|nr:hypothetical protein [archaeon]MBT4396770.1 hypothetical protein [archaeon]MBT4441380.1 hypothetical protein [archaeon]
MELNYLRAVIFLVAGLILLIIPQKIIKIQAYLSKRLHLRSTYTKKANYIISFVLLIIALTLFIYSIIN